MRARYLVAAALVAALIAACGSSSGKSAHGSVQVLYAGSLANLMEHDLGPAFQRADGYGFQGFGAGSTELVAQIKGKVRQGDVFISASPDADAALTGRANGDYVRWYSTFAKAPLVIGFNPHSSFAAQFRHRPWYEVITEPGIRIGRTDPKLDPKGKLTVKAMTLAAAQLRRPQLRAALSHAQVFPEESLVGRLEAGQLDAGFFYSSEATDQHMPTVTLLPVVAGATYTVTILRGAGDPAGAQAFVRYLLGPAGRATLARHGLNVPSTKLTGSSAAVPASLRRLAGAG